ncbi:hypothetical protein CC80DRAFT_258284 [Byssothecium circinans]|uniref:Transmembrane protein n=1 Tax=Byssothecium circinans TaxID=147558 RepID=A0A6A5U6M1_9PLEO|nr:hypothetical protein CC80DRAFT_258284 [Byssothecium circinans]
MVVWREGGREGVIECVRMDGWMDGWFCLVGFRGCGFWLLVVVVFDVLFCFVLFVLLVDTTLDDRYEFVLHGWMGMRRVCCGEISCLSARIVCPTQYLTCCRM